MRMPRPRRRQVRTESIVLTGGLNEVVTSLELKKGELQSCLNYTEIDGPYHGYASIKGFEVYDGKTKPSDISATPLPDKGLDDDTVLYLEAADDPIDGSKYNHLVINNGTLYDTDILKFQDGSFHSLLGTIQVNATNSGEFGPEFSSAFYQEDTSKRSYLNLLDNWTVDLLLRPKSGRISTQTIFEKKGAYKLDIDPLGYLTFYISSDGINYDYSIATVEKPLITTLFTHVSIACKDDVLRIALNGVPAESGGVPLAQPIVPIWQNVVDLFVGADFDGTQNYTGYFDEFRISLGYRWVTNFEIPLNRYSANIYDVYNWDDVNREAQRALIEEVPGVDPVLGCHVYKEELYALRNVDATTAALWKADVTGDDLTAGWVLVDNTFNANGRLDARNSRFSGNFSDREVMIMVDGKSIPRVWDGLTMSLVTDATLPDNDLVTPRYAKLCAIFDGRILLAYAEDDMFLSAKDIVTSFSGGFGTQLNIGDDITNLRELPGEAMAIICATSIKVLTKLETPSGTAASPDYTFKVESFSKQAGGIAGSCERVLSRIMYADDRGVVTLQTTDKYGDFDAAAISKKVNRIYLAKRHLITSSVVVKELNQYRLFFSDGSGLVFTFLEEELKGATYIQYGLPILFATEGKIGGENVRFFTNNTGYVYEMDVGTSFNGEEIETALGTAFYHYKSPRYWKQFMRMIFELTASGGTKFRVRSVFDYDDAAFPATLWWEPLLKGAGGVFGIDKWSEFTWGGSVVQRMVNYIRGHGTNMSIEVTTSSKYNDQHVIHNVIVDYQLENIQE